MFFQSYTLLIIALALHSFLLINLLFKKWFFTRGQTARRPQFSQRIGLKLGQTIRSLSENSFQSVTTLWKTMWISASSYLSRLIFQRMGLSFLLPADEDLIQAGDFSLLSNPAISEDILRRFSFWNSVIHNLDHIALLIDDNRPHYTAFVKHFLNPILQNLVPGRTLIIDRGRLPDILRHLATWVRQRPDRIDTLAAGFSAHMSNRVPTHPQMKALLQLAMETITFCHYNQISPAIGHAVSDHMLNMTIEEGPYSSLLVQHAHHSQHDMTLLENDVIQEIERLNNNFISSCGRLLCVMFSATLSEAVDYQLQQKGVLASNQSLSNSGPQTTPVSTRPLFQRLLLWGTHIFNPILVPVFRVCESTQAKLSLCAMRNSFWRKLMLRPQLVESLCTHLSWLSDTALARSQLKKNITGLTDDEIHSVLRVVNDIVHSLCSEQFTDAERMIFSEFIGAVMRGDLSVFFVSLNDSQHFTEVIIKLVADVSQQLQDTGYLDHLAKLLIKLLEQEDPQVSRVIHQNSSGAIAQPTVGEKRLLDSTPLDLSPRNRMI